MPYHHVFSTHSMLQEQLTDAIIRNAGLDTAEVVVIRVRGSYRAEEEAAYRILDGGTYGTGGGNNVIKHRRRNRAAYERFKREVLDELAPTFQVYSAMYTYWYLRLLAERAADYHILEDGFGSYQSLAEQRHFFASRAELPLAGRLRVWRRRVCQVSAQRPAALDFQRLLDGATSYYTTSPACFPWVEEARKVVVAAPFPPRYVGRYEGATVMGTSCMVETAVLTMEEYLPMLRRVLHKVADRGVTQLYLKFHPAQAGRKAHLKIYRALLAEFAGRMQITELPQGTSIESLAAGNHITFITGVSTLAFHVGATGAEVLSYLKEVEAIGPHSTSYLADGGMEIFRRITTPL